MQQEARDSAKLPSSCCLRSKERTDVPSIPCIHFNGPPYIPAVTCLPAALHPKSPPAGHRLETSLRSILWHSPEAAPPKPCRQPDCDYLEKAPICFSREQLAHEGNQVLRIRLITLQAAEASRALSPCLCTRRTDRAIDQLVYLYILSLRIRSQCLSLLLMKSSEESRPVRLYLHYGVPPAPSPIGSVCTHHLLAAWLHLFSYPENGGAFSFWFCFVKPHFINIDERERDGEIRSLVP